MTEIDFDALVAAGFISKSERVTILGEGHITKKVTVKAHAFSKSAKSAHEEHGGEALFIEK